MNPTTEPGFTPTSTMSEESFSHLTEDVQFVGSLHPMTIMGHQSSGVSIPITLTKREQSDNEEHLPVLNLKIRDERGKICVRTPKDQQIFDKTVVDFEKSLHEVPAEEPELNQVPGASKKNEIGTLFNNFIAFFFLQMISLRLKSLNMIFHFLFVMKVGKLPF